MGSGGVAACEVLGLRGAAAFGGFLGGLFIGLDGVFHLLEADDAHAGAEAAVAAVLLDVAAPGSSAAALPVVAAAAAPTAAAVATAAARPPPPPGPHRRLRPRGTPRRPARRCGGRDRRGRGGRRRGRAGSRSP